MALEKLLNEKLESIIKQKDEEISLVKYVVNVINSDYDNFLSVYNSNDYLNNEEHLFERVKNLIDNLNDIGPDIRRSIFTDAKIKTPGIVLGYTEHVTRGPYCMGEKLTQKGKELVNGYRKIIGKDLLK